MLITEEIFSAFLKCETKSYLKTSGAVGNQSEVSSWQRRRVEDFKQKCYIQFRSNLQEDECLSSTFPWEGRENGKSRLVLGCLVQTREIQTHIHALKRVPSPTRTEHNPYIPVRCVPSEKITKHDKLLLAFDALALSMASGKMPLFGEIIHGREQKSVKVQLAELLNMARSIVERIASQLASQIPPQLILNKHCAECEFEDRCHQVAIEKNDLSLLSGMSEKERKNQHNKGIFSATQLSYTFRPRRRPKRLASRPEKYHHALKALAIREHKIHIAGEPTLKLTENPVYLDVEGVPDQDFYYLIGLLIKEGDAYVQHSFWANDMAEEKQIWTSFLRTLAKIKNPQLIHYGSYETAFLKQMKERYGEVVDSPIFLDQLIAESVNLLSIIYAQIYFPTYSNGLKEIAQYLGCWWSENGASGLKSLMWRSEWECTTDASLKQKLITYNAEDCEATERVAGIIAQLCQRQGSAATSRDDNTVHVDSLKRQDLFYFGNQEFSMPEFQYINRAAYWDYQREKIYVRSSKRLKQVSRRSTKVRTKALPINRIVECPPPDGCPKCKATKVLRLTRNSKIVYDLKFSQTGIKRWIVRYVFHQYSCCRCEAMFYSPQRPWNGEKYGPNMLAYIIHQIIDSKVSQGTVAKDLNLFFKFRLAHDIVKRLKSRAAEIYKGTYERILNKIVNGTLIHADETKVSIIGRNAYVWVFTNMEEVAYVYTETREGDFLQELLKEFKGVLVSDFYTAYDSINSPQQKCLIHLMRDLNNDLLKHAFNEELKELVGEFARLLKPMVETVDRFGLKVRFLRKHKVFVENFYKRLSKRDYQSEIVVKYKKRFEKNRDNLFTFLNFDGVPWNNNNAEHAVKAFALLRNVIGGVGTERGIREYLILLSICETCKYKGVNFLDFLRSGERDIDVFIEKTNRVKVNGMKCR